MFGDFMKDLQFGRHYTYQEKPYQIIEIVGGGKYALVIPNEPGAAFPIPVMLIPYEPPT